MTNAVQTTDVPSALEKAALMGDLADLSPMERLTYYHGVCESLGLNPLTKPFQYIRLNNKLTLYATKDATDQLRSIKGISIISAERDNSDPTFATWIVTGQDRSGRTDLDIGSVPIAKLVGDMRANAIMKALTKAKRRLTLSLAGLGMLDESELGAIASARPVQVDENGEVIEGELSPAQRMLVDRAKGAQDAPQATETIEVDEVPVTASSAATIEDAMDEYEMSSSLAASKEVAASKDATHCGHLPDPNPLGITQSCVKPRDHKGVHGSPDGTWPA